MAEYSVSFTIDVDAETPLDAAKTVAEWLVDGAAARGVYRVTPTIGGFYDSGNAVDVDLDEPKNGGRNEFGSYADGERNWDEQDWPDAPTPEQS